MWECSTRTVTGFSDPFFPWPTKFSPNKLIAPIFNPALFDNVAFSWSNSSFLTLFDLKFNASFFGTIVRILSSEESEWFIVCTETSTRVNFLQKNPLRTQNLHIYHFFFKSRSTHLISVTVLPDSRNHYADQAVDGSLFRDSLQKQAEASSSDKHGSANLPIESNRGEIGFSISGFNSVTSGMVHVWIQPVQKGIWNNRFQKFVVFSFPS